MTKTEAKLTEILKENTGTHMLDSGGHYGRHWQRNQNRFFDEEPVTFFRISNKSGIEVTHNLYHWLAERLEFSGDMNKLWEDFCETPNQKDLYWHENKENFVREYLPSIERDIKENSIDCVNTYNGEDMLSQTIQYNTFVCDDIKYILLEIQNGCDVRGGYTAPVIFEVLEEGCLWDNARATISCNRSDIDPNQMVIPGVERDEELHFWDTDDGGYSWVKEGCWGDNSTNLEKYEISEDEKDRGKGIIYIEDDKAYCPLCGSLLSTYG